MTKQRTIDVNDLTDILQSFMAGATPADRVAGHQAVARTVCPSGHVVVRSSALRAVLERVPVDKRYTPFNELADLITEDV